MKALKVGQVEVGIITAPDGREFSALGSSCVGRNVTGYATAEKGERKVAPLCSWEGGQLTRAGWVARWFKSVNEFGDCAAAVVYPVGRSRFIAGYLLVGSGNLFRGELLPEWVDTEDAGRAAVAESEAWIEADADDAERDRVEQLEHERRELEEQMSREFEV